MKTNMNAPESDGAVSRVLSEWRLAPRRDPGFRAAVRARLAGPGGLTWPGYLRLHAVPVAAACGLALIAGSWLGQKQAGERAAADRAQLAESYVRALDARTMRLP